MGEVDLSRLRDRLRVLRRDALARLAAAGRIDAEMLELIAHTGDALAALEAETMQAVAPIPGDRAVVLEDNLQITIAVYAADRQAAAAVLSPLAAVRLAQKLISAAVPKLYPPKAPQTRRE